MVKSVEISDKSAEVYGWRANDAVILRRCRIDTAIGQQKKRSRLLRALLF